jgi:outer membrane protein assembly factor BamB
MVHPRASLIIIATLVSLGTATVRGAHGGDADPVSWPSFRGKDACGVADGHPTAVAWSVERGTNVTWKVAIPGLAHSSPVIWGDRIFLTTAVRRDGDSHLKVGLYGSPTPEPEEGVHKMQVHCLDRKTGQVLWVRTSIEAEPKIKRHPKGSHAASSPVTDGRHVVAFFASEGMYCYDMEGQLLWTRDFGVLDSGWYAAKGAQFGFASSPIIHEDKLLLQCDVQESSSLCALDVSSGEVLWQTPREDVPSWCSPTVHVSPGRRQVIVNGYRHMGGYDLDTGKELWSLADGGDVPVPTPVVSGNLIYITNGHGRWNPIYAIDVMAEGKIEDGFAAENEPWLAWSQSRQGNYMQTPLVYRDLLYACTDSGVVTCIDPGTGEHLDRTRLGSGRSGFTASPVAADGKIYFTSEEGDIHVLRAGRELETLAVNPLGELCMATPAIAEGVIYFRTQGHLVAISGDDPVTGEEPVTVADAKPEEVESATAAENPAPSVPTADLPPAESLFRGHVLARGGEAALRNHSSMAIEAKLEMPSIGLSMDLSMKRLAPDFFLTASDMPGVGKSRQGYDGEVGWMMGPPAGNMILTGDLLDAAKHEADMLIDLHYGEHYSRMTTVDRTDFHGKTCWVVEAEVYFDVESGLLVGNDGTRTTVMGPMQVITVYEDYEDHDGLLIAKSTRLIIPEHDIEQVIKISSIALEPLDPGIFALPAEIQALRGDGN